MNAILLVVFMALAALTVRSSESVPLKSLCVLDESGTCWISKAENLSRAPEKGDYVVSPADMDRLLNRLKSCRE